ncbi:tetratricopeptide repeat protein 21B-like isoform X2 [Corticium candelabrum]|uniref:tetratricopeptide repeat protein 21B-like isoform X2 n=1 Tax=Corticium candelabrum TaxID=121492 RepID=UPI002E25931F|nr:tetratricopeptide repeat protein 21B-like isoform X2 [Corticium candelabrum]
MAFADQVALARITYYMREGFYQQVQITVLECLTKYGTDPVLVFWKAVAMIMEDRIAEAMRELQTIRDKRDVILCTSMALVYAHKQCATVDNEAVQELESKLKLERKTCGEKALYMAGQFLWLTGRHDKAREYIDRMLKMSPGDAEGATLRAWVDLTCGRDSYVKKSGKLFEEALGMSGSTKLIDSLLGKTKYLEMRHNYSGALEMINQTVVSYPGFIPALIEKMRIQLALQDWDQTVETAQRALDKEGHCIEAVRMIILCQLCQEGQYTEAAAQLGDLIQLVDRFEPKNHRLYYDLSQCFCRVAGRQPLVLQQTLTLVERAQSLAPRNAEYATERAYELMLLQQVKEAVKAYRAAMKLDETSVVALTGVIHCQLLEGQLEDAEQQLEFLQEVQASVGQSADLLYLSAILAHKKGEGADKVMELLNNTIECHFKSLKGLPLGPKYFEKLNPDFLLQIVKSYLVYAPSEVLVPGHTPSDVLTRCNGILDPLTRAAPGILEGVYYLAKVKFLMGDISGAQMTVQHCLDHDATYSDAHLLSSQIFLEQGNFKQAGQSLEVALSYNFEVRENPLYHLVKARIHKQSGELTEASRTLSSALSIPGIKKPVAGAKLPSKSKAKTPSLSDRVTMYLELADTHRLLNQSHEAAKVMQDAIHEFSGTAEEIRVTIANTDLALDRGEIDYALQMLQSITPDKAYYPQAVEKMANIYLYHRKDRQRYAGCYQQLVEKRQDAHSYLLLGDAFMKIQEPDRAIEVYETALKKNPRDGPLASKIGKALAKTHNYSKAINYYETALRSGGPSVLRYDLAELHLKLKQHAKAAKVLNAALEEQHSEDLPMMIDEVRFLMLLARVNQQTGDLAGAVQTLARARDVQAIVVSRTATEQSDAVAKQKSLAGSICCQMAEHSIAIKEFDKAIQLYKDALIQNEKDDRIMLALAKLHLSLDNLDACQHQCLTMLKMNKDNDAATVMMADLMFRKGQYESAAFHFQQLLQRKPDHYEALSRMIELLYRNGRLKESEKFLDQAERILRRPSEDAGLQYCKGLANWRMNKPTVALKLFNLARKDSQWGELATINMIEICFNPDNETIGGEAFESVEGDGSGGTDKRDSEMAAVATAEKLLKELRPKPGSQQMTVLEAFCFLATKSKPNVEKALNMFMEIAAAERDHVPALYGMAAAYMVLKQTPRARNQLKRIAKMSWTAENADKFERSWLLLADIYIQSGKFDMATELLKRCLDHNKSCWKASEYMGYIMEKEQSFKDAAMHYENAWTNGNRNNPAVGYKLAFNYMKAKRFVDAIDVCHQVLATHPAYPKIRREILEKSRLHIRV